MSTEADINTKDDAQDDFDDENDINEEYDDDDDEFNDAGNEDIDDGAGNRVEGGSARSVLEYVARSIVDDPKEVMVEVESARNGRVEFSLSVAPDDMGKVIGKRGRVAQAIRTVVRAAGTMDDIEASVDIVD